MAHRPAKAVQVRKAVAAMGGSLGVCMCSGTLLRGMPLCCTAEALHSMDGLSCLHHVQGA